MEEDSSTIEKSRRFETEFAARPSPLEEHTNYQSFYEEAEAADADFNRAVEKGYADRSVSPEEIRRAFGTITLARVAVVPKLRRYG